MIRTTGAEGKGFDTVKHFKGPHYSICYHSNAVLLLWLFKVMCC